ncbi:MAG: hypothetical protein FWD01_05425 [Defluviitaleaceae bacterium]|nr:hypothetical protein [Defluviitaleaceae bacterium]
MSIISEELDKKGKEKRNYQSKLISFNEFAAASQADFHDPNMDENEDIEDFLTPEDLDELQKSFDLLEAEIEKARSLPKKISIISPSSDDSDERLRRLMELEEKAEARWRENPNNFDLDDIMSENVSIYEGDNPYQKMEIESMTSKKREKFTLSGFIADIKERYIEGDKTTKILMLAIAAIAAIGVLAVVFFLGAAISNAVSTQNQMQATAIHQPPQTFNNNSYIFTNMTAFVGEEEININRMLLDELATVFKFSDELDLERFHITLEDFGGKIYHPDLAFAHNPKRDEMLESATIRFEPLDRLVAGFTIGITDTQTGEHANFNFTFDGDITPAIFINSPIDFGRTVNGIESRIDSANFSAAGSTINFSVQVDLAGASLVFVENAISAPVTMRHLGSATAGIFTHPEIHMFEQNGLILGRMDFRPLRTLTGDVGIYLSHMFLRYDLSNRPDIPAHDFFISGPDRSQEMTFGDFSLIIEGMQRQGDFIVMPLHGVNNTIFAGSGAVVNPGAFNRIETFIDATLIGITSYGEQLRLPGTVRYDTRGADVIFNMDDLPEMRQIPTTRMFLQIDGVYFRTGDLSTTIQLSNAERIPSDASRAMRSEIERHFITRLDYMRGTRTFDQITGFSENILHSEIIEHYMPINMAGARNISYDAQVQSYRQLDSHIYAVVIEYFTYTNEGRLHEVTRRHSIIGEIQGNGEISIIRNQIID